MAVILNFCPVQDAKDQRIARETARKLGQVIIFPGVRIERHVNSFPLNGDEPEFDKAKGQDER